jgi:hypothetical protein
VSGDAARIVGGYIVPAAVPRDLDCDIARAAGQSTTPDGFIVPDGFIFSDEGERGSGAGAYPEAG